MPIFGTGEAGISIHLSVRPDGNNELLMGAPGSRLFAGSVTRYNDGQSSPGLNRKNAFGNEFKRFMSVRLPESRSDYYNTYFGKSKIQTNSKYIPRI